MKRLLLLFLLLSLFSCSTMSVKSGHYIKLRSGETLTKVSKTFNVSKWELKEANPSKSFVSGEWVFIPLKRGVLGQGRSPANYTPGVYDQYFGTGEFIWPVPASKRISSDFGHRWGRKHEGIDIPAKKGSHIIASLDGVVVYSGSEYSGYGNIMIVAHRNGYFTIYAHNHKNLVYEGQRVTRGQVIGLVGNTGRSTGSHLHFEVRKDSRALNPNKFLARN